MFLGTHTPRLDDKGRLILPAKFRDELAGGVVITKGQERCLYVFPIAEFQRIAEQLREQPMTHKAARAYSRVFFASAHDEVPDKQGRVTIPAPPAGVRRARPRTRRDRGEHPGGDLGQAGLGDLPRGERRRLRRHRGGGAARRTVGGVTARARECPATSTAAVPRDLQPLVLLAPLPRRQARRSTAGASSRRATSGWGSGGTAAAHSGYGSRTARHQRVDGGRHGGASRHARTGAARAVPRAARPRAGVRRPAGRTPVHVDATLGLGGHAEAVLAAHPAGRRSSGSTGTPRRSRTPGDRLAPLRRPDAPGARGLRRAARRAGPSWASPRSTACCSTSASPRCSSTSRTAGSPTRRTRRWTCGWTRPAGITAEEVVNSYAAGDLARVLRVYGEEKFAAPDRRGDRAGAGDGRRSPRRPGWPSWSRDAIPAPARRTGRQSRQANVPGAADRGKRRADRAGGGAAGGSRRAGARAGGWWCCPTTRWRTGSSSRRSPPGRAAPHRSTCRSSRPAPGRRCGCSPAARSCRARRRSRPTRGPPRCGCAPRSTSISTGTGAARERPRRALALHLPTRPVTARTTAGGGGHMNAKRDQTRQHAPRSGGRAAARESAAVDSTRQHGADARARGAAVRDAGQRGAGAGGTAAGPSRAAGRAAPWLRVAPPLPVVGAPGAVRRAAAARGGRRRARHPAGQHEDQRERVPAATTCSRSRPRSTGRSRSSSSRSPTTSRRATWPPRRAGWAWCRPTRRRSSGCPTARSSGCRSRPAARRASPASDQQAAGR